MPRPQKSAFTILSTDADIRRGVIALRRACPVMRRVHDQTGDPPLRRQEPGFAGLMRIVVAQQVSAASATAIWKRTEATLRTITPRTIATSSDDTLRACGLSRPKMRTMRAVAGAVLSGELDVDRLRDASDADVHAALTRLHGIGPWTADIYLMFSLGRADAWASGDLALQLAIGRAFGLVDRPTAHNALSHAEHWRPWRGVAARLLWAYYALPGKPAPKQAVTRGSASKTSHKKAT